jgi:hypothetical protein
LEATLSAVDGVPSGACRLLGSTNVSVPLLNWLRLATNLFDAAGGVTFTNPILPGSGQQFYRLQLL